MGDDRPVEETTQQVAELQTALDDLKAQFASMVGRRPTGDIEPTVRSAAKTDTILLQGQTLNRTDYPRLWQWAQDQGLVVAGLFGAGNGTSTFTVPDFRGRMPIGVGTLGSDTYALGGTGGASTVTLTTAQMPSHAHTTSGDGDHNGHFPGTSFLAANGPDLGLAAWNSSGNLGGQHGHTINPTGGGTSHENRPPYLAINWLMWV